MANFLLNMLGLGGGDATMQASSENYGEINRGHERGQAILAGGKSRAQGYLDKVTGLYEPLAGATGLYADAMGLGGADGNTRATEAFQTGPGYEFAVGQGLDALGRKASSLGRYQSGGTEADFMDYNRGMANQEYGGWLERLSGASTTALNGLTGANNNLANLETNDAANALTLDQTTTGARIDNNNMFAQGGEQQAAGQAAFGANLGKLAGKAFGYGGF